MRESHTQKAAKPQRTRTQKSLSSCAGWGSTRSQDWWPACEKRTAPGAQSSQTRRLQCQPWPHRFPPHTKHPSPRTMALQKKPQDTEGTNFEEAFVQLQRHHNLILHCSRMRSICMIGYPSQTTSSNPTKQVPRCELQTASEPQRISFAQTLCFDDRR